MNEQINSIARLVAAINAQCGLLASYSVLHHTDELGVSVTAQVRLVDTPIKPDDWAHFQAGDHIDGDLERMRDELRDFIVANRPSREDAA
ncbi:MAG: hypothetical protein R3215_07740 [Halomonas sp.]|nr:hypothetical protein [Halomonas sp.]